MATLANLPSSTVVMAHPSGARRTATWKFKTTRTIVRATSHPGTAQSAAVNACLAHPAHGKTQEATVIWSLRTDAIDAVAVAQIRHVMAARLAGCAHRVVLGTTIDNHVVEAVALRSVVVNATSDPTQTFT